MCKYDRDFWKNSYPKSTHVTVGTTRSKILQSNPERIAFIISNTGANALFISPAGNVTINDGIEILANGANQRFSLWEVGGFVSCEMWGIYETAGATIEIIEILEIPKNPTQ